MITANKAKEILEREKELVKARGTGDCEFCEASGCPRTSQGVLEAYDKAILLLQRESYFEFLRGVEQG